MPKMIGMMRLGRDAELRVTSTGEQVASLSLAYNYGKADQDGKRKTTWINASMWGERAAKLAPYLTKGSLHCFTLDDLRLETFTRTADNTQGTKIAARVLDVEFGPRQETGQQPAAKPAPKPAPKPAAPTGSTGSGFDDLANDDPDDIPF